MGNKAPCCGGRDVSSGFRGKVLVTGATGLLGRQVMRVFQERGWTLRGLAFSRASGALVKCDLFDSAQLAHQFQDFQPDIVIHCAAERRPDKLEADKDYAIRINADVARSVGKLAKEHQSWLIYLSTNYVFDGKAAPYKEDGVPCPINVYGESKLAGERAVAEVHPGAAILRVPLLYGPIEKLEETSLTALLKTVKEAAPKLDNWQERFPTNTEDLALVMEAFCEAQCRSLSENNAENTSRFAGIFHWQANDRQTKFSMGTTIAEIAGLSTKHLVKVDAAPAPGSAPRPQFERMLCGRLENILASSGYQPDRFRCDFKACLARHLQ
eukprot:CAMPEP_0197664020 /NCGR_PEP_ID=MMETSP1338-20131121/58382_1 /TAXON_ID=43686 ORGANISM="Pelagodinium beii, Strain RCC1491" /NCGR_SAMPLE_ID=MMETSP1338 /ASSEMBLY_ACC=CAM_ASM_000754 /LENGTH=325 /DNA_ID=CAMNT_0043242571 /DNA_START=12 /DNA_END=986 /DNA_ORIENTATION=+